MAPSNPSKNSGFRIKIKDKELLFKAIRKGASGQLGINLLEKPLEQVEVELRNESGSFNLIGQVEIDFNVRHNNRLFEERIRRTVAEKYGQIVERGGSYIIVAPRGTKLILSCYLVGINHIWVTTGLVDGTFETVQAIPAPKSDTENLEDIIIDFLDVLEVTVEEVYKRFGKTSPDEELIINSPKQKKSGNGLRDRMGAINPNALLGKLEIECPDVAFEDIGGQSKAKREIEGLAFAVKNPELYKKWGTKPPKGVVLYGPPGTGKTLMAKALATQADAKFFHVEASDIASKWYGESEQIVKMVFELANSNEGNTIVFFDEIDAIAPYRDGAHEATQRVIGTLLENLDGLASNANVMVVASTNRLKSVDPALLRPGRFDRWVEVPLPDSDGRNQIFSIHMTSSEKTAERELFNGADFSVILSRTVGFSGADIAEVVRRALEEKVRLEGATGDEPETVITEDIIQAIETYERIKESRQGIGFAPNGLNKVETAVKE